MTQIDNLEARIDQMKGECRRLAKDLIAIAKMAMPDTYFASDKRVRYAKGILTRYKKGS